MRKHLFAKTAQDVRRTRHSRTTFDNRKVIAPPSTRRSCTTIGEPCKPLQAREGAAKPVSPMEFP